MSLPADFDLKERVRSALDIVDVIGATLELHPRGRNFLALCPWHNDRRPSLSVNQERQTWKCWPCDIGGDIFSFVMQRDGVDFPTALRSLAEIAGIPVEEQRRGKQTQPGNPDDRATLLAAMQLVSDAYFERLENCPDDDAKLARDYLNHRGIDDQERRRFRIGFSPDSWSFAVDLLRQHKFSGEVALASGVASAKRSGTGFVDMFRGRLMFPIHDLQDRPIALGGRLIPEIAARHGENAGGKYINGRETLLFRKSNQLYGLQLARDAIRRDGEVLVMEGYTDVVATRQAGIEQVVAVLGTALGEGHIKLLQRFAQRVVLVLDGDTAGQNRADEVLELFVRADVDLRVLTLPEGSDPADFVQQQGPDALRQLVAAAPDALDHKLARLTQGVEVDRDTHAVTTAVDTMLKIVAPAPDGLRVDQLLLRMSRTFDFKVERLERRLQVLRAEAERRSRFQKPRAAGGQSRDQPRMLGNQPIQSRPPGMTRSQIDAVDPNAAFAESAEHEFEPSGETPIAAAAGRSSEPKLLPLRGVDRDLFETLIEDPDLAATAVETIDPKWFESTTAMMLLSAYQDLDLAGHAMDVDSLLLVIDNQQLKNQIVTLQERVQQRVGKMPESSEQRYASVMDHYRRRAFNAEQSRQIEKLASASMGEDEEVELLKALIEEERLRRKSVGQQ